MDEGKIQKIKIKTYLAIGQMLKLFAASAGISFNRYYKIIAPCLATEAEPMISPETVKRYTNRGIPKKLSYSRLSAAIEQAYQSYVSDPTLEDGKRLTAEKAHESYYPQLLEMVREQYHIIELTDVFAPFMTEDFQMQRVLQSFMNGMLFDDDKAPDQKTLELLKKSLQRFPPKGMEGSD